MEPRIQYDEYEAAYEQARKDKESFPEGFRPSVRHIAARNMIQDAIGGGMGSAQSVELTPINHDQDGVWYGVTVVQKPGRRSIDNRVSLIAGYAGLNIHVVEDGETDDDVDELDDDEKPRLTYRLVK